MLANAKNMFSEAFERLKLNVPTKLPKDSPVTQNNVAREAGRDPSALRKSRYPELIAQIQNWIEKHEALPKEKSAQSNTLSQKKISSLKQRNRELKIQRDLALSLLIEADAKILELTMEIAQHKNDRL